MTHGVASELPSRTNIAGLEWDLVPACWHIKHCITKYLRGSNSTPYLPGLKDRRCLRMTCIGPADDTDTDALGLRGRAVSRSGLSSPGCYISRGCANRRSFASLLLQVFRAQFLLLAILSAPRTNGSLHVPCRPCASGHLLPVGILRRHGHAG